MQSYKRHLILLAALSVVLFSTFYITSIYFGNNPLNNRLNTKIKMISLLPEGWAFFTRASNEPRQYTFKLEGDKFFEVNLRNFSSEYYFGMSRHNRVLSLELSTVFQKVNNDTSIHYLYTATDVQQVITKIKKEQLTFNEIALKKHTAPDIHGKYLMVVQLMLPWSLLNRDPDYPTNFIAYPINVTTYE
jgi:antimicrobial peptide system SdpA family protein